MSYAVSEIIPVGVTTPVSLINPTSTLAIKVSNKSPYDLQYTGYGSSGSDWIASGTEQMLSGLVNNFGSIALTPYNTSGVFPVNPAAVLLVFYVSGDKIPEGHWPVTIPFQTVQIGGGSTTTSQYVKDDLDVAGVVFVEATVQGDASSSVTITNDAVINLGTATRPGKLNVNGTLGSPIVWIDSSGNLNVGFGAQINTNSIAAQSAQDLLNSVSISHKHVFAVNATNIVIIDSGGINFPQTGGQKMSGWAWGNGLTGAGGNVTITHNLGVIPSAVLLTERTNVNDIFSVTNITSTQFTANVSVAAIRGFSWLALI